MNSVLNNIGWMVQTSNNTTIPQRTTHGNTRTNDVRFSCIFVFFLLSIFRGRLRVSFVFLGLGYLGLVFGGVCVLGKKAKTYLIGELQIQKTSAPQLDNIPNGNLPGKKKEQKKLTNGALIREVDVALLAMLPGKYPPWLDK